MMNGRQPGSPAPLSPGPAHAEEVTVRLIGHFATARPPDPSAQAAHTLARSPASAPHAAHPATRSGTVLPPADPQASTDVAVPPSAPRTSAFAGLLGGLLRFPVRVPGNGQPDASAPLLYCLRCAGGSGVLWSLVAYRDSGQAGALLDIECQSCRFFRRARRRDRYSLHRPVLSWLGACPVLIAHGSQSLPLGPWATRRRRS